MTFLSLANELKPPDHPISNRLGAATNLDTLLSKKTDVTASVASGLWRPCFIIITIKR